MKHQPSKSLRSPLLRKAEQALCEAVQEVVENHRRAGLPLAVWRDGRVVFLPPDQVVVRELPAAYRTKRKH
jgi:hypothetical protein